MAATIGQSRSARNVSRGVSALWPHSLRSLALLGFAWVAAPLIVLLVFAAVSLHQLARDSGRLVYQAVDSTQYSRMLMEQLVTMERNARQFQVLEDRTLFDLYEKSRAEFVETGRALSAMPLETALHLRVDQLIRDEAALHGRLSGAVAGQTIEAPVLDRFAGLNEQASALWIESSDLVSRRVDELNQKAKRLQHSLLWQIALLVPLALVLAGVFTQLIARPIRELDRAIHRLGDERFEESLQVQGPRDLRYLGERLDWLRRRLRDLEQNKQRFLRNVSHDLKTPLTTLREGSALLSDEVVGELNSEQREIAGILCRSADQLGRQIENLLNHGREEGGRSALNPQWLEMQPVVETVLQAHGLALRAKGLSVEKQLRRVRLWGDRERLGILIDNLVGNAVKYSPAGAPIEVSLAREGGMARLEVIDRGPGVSEDEAERIFEPFVRGRSAAEQGVGGTGLGLAIVRDTAQAHGGRVEVMSTPGGGATFRVWLPLDFREAQA